MKQDINFETLGEAGIEAIAAIRGWVRKGNDLWFKEDLSEVEENFKRFAEGKGSSGTFEKLESFRNKTIASPEGAASEWNIWNKNVQVGTLNESTSLEEILRSIGNKLKSQKTIN